MGAGGLEEVGAKFALLKRRDEDAVRSPPAEAFQDGHLSG